MAKESYRDVTVNPCNMCMPMGGLIPFKGVEKAMVILHGSQGCATYMRRQLAEHFNEPIDVASSSLNEKGTVYGGENNLKQGLQNLIKLYNPGLVGVLTTCLAETIGEDIARITANFLAEKGLDLPIVPVATPGYAGSHAEGYWHAAGTIVRQLARQGQKHGRINIIVPHISPADLRELKRILELFRIDYILFPDFSDTLDRPFARPYQKIAAGGTKLADLSCMAGAAASVELGGTVEESHSPGSFLAREYGVPLYKVPIPLGLEYTDAFMSVLQEISGRPLPATLSLERGRLLDCMIDAHKHNAQGTGAIFGEPELVLASTKTCLENGIFPGVIATGSRNALLASLLGSELAACPREPYLLTGADFLLIQEKCRETGVNIAIGPSDGRYLTEQEGIPLVRLGFPILDRVGGQRLLSVGYTGTALFLDRVTNTLLESKYSRYRRSIYEQYYPLVSGE